MQQHPVRGLDEKKGFKGTREEKCHLLSLVHVARVHVSLSCLTEGDTAKDSTRLYPFWSCSSSFYRSHTLSSVSRHDPHVPPPPSTLSPDNPSPSHILHRPFTPASHEAFLLLWIVESHVQRSRGSHTYRGGLYVWMCTRKAGAMGISYKTLWGPESERRRQVPAADIWWHSLHYFTSVWDQDIEYSISNAATCFWCDVSVTKATNTS